MIYVQRYLNFYDVFLIEFLKHDRFDWRFHVHKVRATQQNKYGCRNTSLKRY